MTKRALIAAVATLAVLGGSAAMVYRETRPQARDRRAIVAHLRQMERAMRNHDEKLWLHVTITHPVEPGDTCHAATHEAMLRDFERLRNLERLEMTGIEVELAGDTALARYHIRGAPVPPSASPHPKAGELRFVRGPQGWEMTGHRFLQ